MIKFNKQAEKSKGYLETKGDRLLHKSDNDDPGALVKKAIIKAFIWVPTFFLLINEKKQILAKKAQQMYEWLDSCLYHCSDKTNRLIFFSHTFFPLTFLQ